MAGGIPLNQATGSALMGALARSSPPANSATPKDRTEPRDKFLERLRSIRALIKSISDEGLSEDPDSSAVLEAFNSAVRNLLLGLPGAEAMQVLRQHLGMGTPGLGMGQGSALGLPQQPPVPGLQPPVGGPQNTGMPPLTGMPPGLPPTG